jgi:hypothetical protein
VLLLAGQQADSEVESEDEAKDPNDEEGGVCHLRLLPLHALRLHRLPFLLLPRGGSA